MIRLRVPNKMVNPMLWLKIMLMLVITIIILLLIMALLCIWLYGNLVSPPGHFFRPSYYLIYYISLHLGNGHKVLICCVLGQTVLHFYLELHHILLCTPCIREEVVRWLIQPSKSLVWLGVFTSARCQKNWLGKKIDSEIKSYP